MSIYMYAFPQKPQLSKNAYMVLKLLRIEFKDKEVDDEFLDKCIDAFSVLNPNDEKEQIKKEFLK